MASALGLQRESIPIMVNEAMKLVPAERLATPAVLQATFAEEPGTGIPMA
jgi:hypothetical protein